MTRAASLCAARPSGAPPAPMRVAALREAPVGSLRRLAGSFGGAAAAGALARAAQLALALLLAVSLGTAGFGMFAFALSVGTVAGQLGVLGWPTLFLRHAPGLAARGDAAALARLRRASLRGTALGAAAATAILAASASVMSAAGAAEMAAGLALSALIAPSVALRSLAHGQLNVLYRPALGLLLDEAAPPLAAAAAALALGPEDPALAVATLSAAGFASGLVGLLAARRAAERMAGPPGPPIAAGAAAAEARVWAAEAPLLMAGQIPRLFAAKADVMLIAPILGYEATGLYAAAMRIAYLVSAPALLLAQALQPWTAAACQSGARRRLRRLLAGGCGAAAAWSLLAGGAAVWQAGALAALFGPGFGAAAGLVGLLIAAEAMAATGQPLNVVAISGPNYRRLAGIGLALALTQAATLALALPIGGVTAAAVVHLAVSAAQLTLVAALALPAAAGPSAASRRSLPSGAVRGDAP